MQRMATSFIGSALVAREVRGLERSVLPPTLGDRYARERKAPCKIAVRLVMGACFDDHVDEVLRVDPIGVVRQTVFKCFHISSGLGC